MRENTDEAKRCSGFWRVTPEGMAFAQGQITVPSHAFVYNNRVEGWSITRITVFEALEKDLNYAELWNEPL